MDTIYAEGQRRYVESLSSYARQFVGQMQKPQVDHIDGLSPAIAIEQTQHRPHAALDRRHGHRDLRLLPHPVRPARPAALPRVRHPDRHANGRRDHRQAARRAGRHEAVPHGAGRSRRRRAVRDAVGRASRRRLLRVRIDGETHSLDAAADDRSPPQARGRSRSSTASSSGRTPARASPTASRTRSRWAKACCTWRSCRRRRAGAALAGHASTASTWPASKCGRSFEPLTPHNFSFNSPLGWCPACEGLGTQIGANPAALFRDAN